MKTKKQAIMGTCILLSMMTCLTGAVSARELAPMPVRQAVDIPDGEHLHYTITIGGHKYGEVDEVTRYENANTVKVYINEKFMDSERPVPPVYTNYQMYSIVNLSTASIVSEHYDFSDYFVRENKQKGIYFMDVKYGPTITCVYKTWDGYESRQSTTRSMNVDTSYPVWSLNSFIFWGGRLLDWERQGVVMIWDSYLKDPTLGSLTILGEETVDTPVGRFQAVKVGLKVADPFLASVLRTYTDSVILWMEKGPKHRFLKCTMGAGNQVWILDGYNILS